jgi:hypothetical protein
MPIVTISDGVGTVEVLTNAPRSLDDDYSHITRRPGEYIAFGQTVEAVDVPMEWAAEYVTAARNAGYRAVTDWTPDELRDGTAQ